MKPHLRYLRYVLLHKWYVLRAGIVINGWSLPWLWRLLVHDLSKFSRAEWGPYVAEFYRTFPSTTADQSPAAAREAQERKRAFNAAWLHHIHANPHHWQHWMLHQDDGRVLALLPPNAVVNEMIADWLAAGTKINSWPTMQRCVAETIVWYSRTHKNMTMRQPVREHVEATLVDLAESYGLYDLAQLVHATQVARVSLTINPASR
jgi:hypothetical protein